MATPNVYDLPDLFWVGFHIVADFEDRLPQTVRIFDRD
jgi:hypothetical protein